MDNSCENLADAIKEELVRLGVPAANLDTLTENKKSSLYQTGTKFLGFSNNNQARDKGKSKYGNCDSPKLMNNSHDVSKNILTSLSIPQSGNKTPSKYDNIKIRRNAPKSPFSSKSRNERKSGRKKNGMNNGNKQKNQLEEVFGRELDSISLCAVQLKDGTVVKVPEFIIDVSNFIRRNITVEGIFRKAGSSQRQNDVKKLINCGINLPSTVHPIDAACLLKQFLRSLPTSLLASPVHSLMTNCLDIKNTEDQQKALSLCTMLLPKTHQHLLSYILELLSDVAAASDKNMMDARNLGIVLAPNLLPALNFNCTSKKSIWFNDDHLLTSTISILECLIDGATGICRLSNSIVEEFQNRERSQSMENLTDAPPSCGSQKKKRRSASIHRLMNGIRRVVQGGGSLLNSQPTVLAPSPKAALTPIRTADKSSSVNMHPAADHSSPGSAKRKSETFESPQDKLSGNVLNAKQLDFDRPKKKPRMDLPVSVRWASSCNSQGTADKKELNQIGLFKTRHPKAIQSLVTVREDPQEYVKRSYSLREKRVATNSPVRKDEIKSRNQVKRRKSCELGSSAGKTPLKLVHSRTMRSFPVVSPSTPSLSPLINHPNSSILLPLRPSTPLRRRDSRRKSLKDHYLPNCPDGSEDSPLGHRGIPDGSDCNIRDSPAAFRNSDPILSLEKQYDEIKYAVKTMEEEIDRDNIQQIKGEFLLTKNNFQTSNNVNYSQIIHAAYERMKTETKDLDCSPSDYLSRRLGKELKIRSRRSDEHRVMRSPSERKIGSIRRRSKELEQSASKNQGGSVSSNTTLRAMTPKFKGSLLGSPHSALKRGKPNSLRSGLPVIVKPANTVGLPGVANVTPAMGICIAKRPSSRKSPRQDNDTFYSSFSSTQNHQGSSYLSLNESILGSFADDYTGPMTRRRSSILSSNSLPILNLNSPENSLNDSSKSFSGICLDLKNEFNGLPPFELEEEKENVNLDETYVKDTSNLPTHFDKDSSEETMEWVPATTYMKNIHDEPLTTTNALHTCEPGGSRPSIAALMKQKKVTANVQLFSQLQGPNGMMITPTSMRRSTRYKRIMSSHAPLRCVASERRVSRSRLPSERSRLTLTPLDLRPSRSRQPKSSSERSSANIATPRIMCKETPSNRNSRTKFLDGNSILPTTTPLPPRPYKPSVMTSTTPNLLALNLETPPKLPPRFPTNSIKKAVTNKH